ncbi:DUF7331 family protein (plasmid) [Haloarcula marismortui]|uniref:DUF7331 family protein n=1 Tax=Haloarcula marismortui TaxID=2238 RepID=UPI003C772B36
MPTESGRKPDELLTTGPVADEYERYQYIQTEGDALIYDEEREEAWIQASDAVDLETWR